MQIGIIGAGRIGQAAATRLVAAGHEVTIANSRGPQTLAELVASLGAGVRAGTAAQAAESGDVVLVAVPLHAIGELPAAELVGRIVIDANNYYPDRDGRIAELDAGDTGSSEMLAAALPGARVVKAFNTIYYERLAHENRPAGSPDRLAIPLAGDDPEAKRIVAGLINDMGFDPVDAGSLADGRNQQPGTPVYNQPVGADGVRAALGIG
ncbi:MAG: NADPH-dependent F420 reductase [Solirubrobacteraceae bacterium]